MGVRTNPDVSDLAVLIKSMSLLSSALALFFLLRDLERDLELDLDLDLTFCLTFESFLAFGTREIFSFEYGAFFVTLADLLGVLDWKSVRVMEFERDRDLVVDFDLDLDLAFLLTLFLSLLTSSCSIKFRLATDDVLDGGRWNVQENI